MAKGILKIATCQFAVNGSVKENSRSIRRYIRKAGDSRADIVHFSECALSGYVGTDFPNFDNYDWDLLKTETLKIMSLAAESKIWVVLGSTHRLTEPNKPHNSLYLINPKGDIVDRYDKRFCTPGDLRRMTPGNHFVNFTINGVKCSLLICFDLRFPEIYRAIYKEGVHCVLQSFYNAKQTGPSIHTQIMRQTMQSHAACNHFWISMANSSGYYSPYPSCLIQPDGKIVKQLRANRPGLMINTVDLKKTFYDPMKNFRDIAAAGKLDNSLEKTNDPRSKNTTILRKHIKHIVLKKESDSYMANNTVTAPKGFLAAGLHCGIKQSGKNDLGLIACPGGAKAAAVFTTNKIQSAAVQISRKHIKSAKVFAVVVNSGNANACTGRTGIKNAVKMCEETASQIEENPHAVIVASTGIIGEQLPIKKISTGIPKAAEQLSASPKAGLDFANAIMTTDTKPKQTIRTFEISGTEITIAGTVKGAGMIAPNMATTLCFITTDVAITKALLNKALNSAIGNSLNKLTVDGHQSTNDTAVILASGSAGNRPIASQCPRYKKFSKALTDLCDDLARQMAHDAEGATRIFKVIVNGAASGSDAAKACRAIADYPLVKCAIHGGDPNWGRIICAVGSTNVKLNPEKLSCKIGSVKVFQNGTPKKFDTKKVSKIVSQDEHTITVDLGVGTKSDFCYGCDLSAEYVSINADYHT